MIPHTPSRLCSGYKQGGAAGLVGAVYPQDPQGAFKTVPAILVGHSWLANPFAKLTSDTRFYKDTKRLVKLD